MSSTIPASKTKPIKKAKRPQKYSEKWDQQQLKRYIQFLIVNRKKIDGIYIVKEVAQRMKSHIITQKTPEQCARQNLAYLKRYKSFHGVIQELTKKIKAKVDDLKWQAWVLKYLRQDRHVKAIECKDLLNSIIQQITMEEEAFVLMLSNLNTNDWLVQEKSKSQYQNLDSLNAKSWDKQTLQIPLRLMPEKLEGKVEEKVPTELSKCENELSLEINKSAESEQNQEENQEQSQHNVTIQELKTEQNWSTIVKLRVLIFLLRYMKTFIHRKKLANQNYQFSFDTFVKMSQFIGNNKTRQQCFTYCLDTIERTGSIQKFVEYLLTNLTVDPKDVNNQIERIQTFYQNHRHFQLNAMNNRFMKLQIEQNNKELIRRMLREKFDHYEYEKQTLYLKKKQKEVFFRVDYKEDKILLENDQDNFDIKQENQQGVKYCFDIQIPILLQLTFEKQQTQNQIRKISKDNSPNEPIREIHQNDSAFQPYVKENTQNNERKKEKKKNKRPYFRQKGREQIYDSEEDENMPNMNNSIFGNSNKYQNIITQRDKIEQQKKEKNELISEKDGKLNKTKQKVSHWTVSEKIKVLTFLYLNPQPFSSNKQMLSSTIERLTQFVGTKKDLIQCRQKIHSLRKKHQADYNQIMENESKRLCIRFDMIRLRQKLCQEVSRSKQNMGTYDLIVETIPSLLFINEKKFNSEHILSKIEEMDLRLKIFADLTNRKLANNKANQQFVIKDSFPAQRIDPNRTQIENTGITRTNKHLIKAFMKFSSLPEEIQEVIGKQKMKYQIEIVQNFKFYAK